MACLVGKTLLVLESIKNISFNGLISTFFIASSIDFTVLYGLTRRLDNLVDDISHTDVLPASHLTADPLTVSDFA